VAQGQVLEGELAVAAEQEGEESKVEQEGNHRAGIVSGSEPTDQPLAEVLAKDKYKIVLTDLLMSGMSGWDVLEAVRLRDPHIPIIVITGAPVSDALASQPGVAVLKKPVDVTALNTMIQRMLNRRSPV